MRTLLPILLFLAHPITMHAAQCSATANKPVALVELYTSEGCSSCPPADKWLAALARSSLVPASVVPLALHVPYWDYIGWRDRFASPQFERRQQEVARRGYSTTVYTPQVLLNGRSLPDWQSGGLDRALAAFTRQGAKATLTLATTTGSGGTEVTISGSAPAGSLIVLARYENALISEVKAGENKGVRLSHNNVVRDWVELGSTGSDGLLNFKHSLRNRADVKAENTGLAAFVQDAKGEILQAVMLPRCAGG